MIDLGPLSRAIAVLPADHPEEWGDCYWQAYAHLAAIKKPASQQRLMMLLAKGADLQAASEIFHAAFPYETGYSFQLTSARGGLPWMSCTMNRRLEQLTGPHLATSGGHAVLLAAVCLTNILRNESLARNLSGR